MTPAQDADEVIIAGVAEEPPAKGDRQSGVASLPKLQAVHGGASDSDEKSAVGKDQYQETTLEDLEGAKMPLAQRIVIVAAVICIIGAVVYYLLAMR